MLGATSGTSSWVGFVIGGGGTAMALALLGLAWRLGRLEQKVDDVSTAVRDLQRPWRQEHP